MGVGACPIPPGGVGVAYAFDRNFKFVIQKRKYALIARLIWFE